MIDTLVQGDCDIQLIYISILLYALVQIFAG